MGILLFMAIALVLTIKAMTNIAIKSKSTYIEAGTLSEQAFTGIKTVKSMNGEEHEFKAYELKVISARDKLIKAGIIQAVCLGSFFFFMYFNYGLGFWIGGKFIVYPWVNFNSQSNYESDEIVTCFFAIFSGIIAITILGPSLNKVSKGIASSKNIYKVIDRIPDILENDTSISVPKDEEIIKGEIEFINVDFNYLSRPSIDVLKNLSFKIPAGKKVAFVGEAGCGKSTTIQLVERFYDALNGQI